MRYADGRHRPVVNIRSTVVFEHAKEINSLLASQRRGLPLQPLQVLRANPAPLLGGPLKDLACRRICIDACRLHLSVHHRASVLQPALCHQPAHQHVVCGAGRLDAACPHVLDHAHHLGARVAVLQPDLRAAWCSAVWQCAAPWRGAVRARVRGS